MIKIILSLIVGVVAGISFSLVNWNGRGVKERPDLTQEPAPDSGIAGFWKVENTLIFFDTQSDLAGVARNIHMTDDGVVISLIPWELTDLKAFKGFLDDSLLPMEEIYIDSKKKGKAHKIIASQVYRFRSTGGLFFHLKSENRNELIEFNSSDSDVMIESYTKVLDEE